MSNFAAPDIYLQYISLVYTIILSCKGVTRMIPKSRDHLTTKLLLIFSAFLLLFSAVPLDALASGSSTEKSVYEGTIELTGQFNGQFHLTPDDLELFHIENMVPGDRWEGKLHVKNKARDTMEISIISIASNLEDKILYDALDLEIRVGEEIVYDGSYGDTTKPISKIYRVYPRKTVTFDIAVELPQTVGNEMMHREMDSTWTFEARYYGGSSGKKPVNTGFDLTQSNTDSLISALLFVVCLGGFLIVLLRIRKTKEEADRQQKVSSSHDRREHWDESR